MRAPFRVIAPTLIQAIRMRLLYVLRRIYLLLLCWCLQSLFGIAYGSAPSATGCIAVGHKGKAPHARIIPVSHLGMPAGFEAAVVDAASALGKGVWLILETQPRDTSIESAGERVGVRTESYDRDEVDREVRNAGLLRRIGLPPYAGQMLPLSDLRQFAGDYCARTLIAEGQLPTDARINRLNESLGLRVRYLENYADIMKDFSSMSAEENADAILTHLRYCHTQQALGVDLITRIARGENPENLIQEYRRINALLLKGVVRENSSSVTRDRRLRRSVVNHLRDESPKILIIGAEHVPALGSVDRDDSLEATSCQ